MRSFVPFDNQENGGADFSKVVIKDNTPSCIQHGAMNKVSKHGLWRCLYEGCRAACQEQTN